MERPDCRTAADPGSNRKGGRPMTARMLPAARQVARLVLLAGLIPAVCGCQGGGNAHATRKIPQLGGIDPNQSRELQMVSMPPYVIEPPDELEVAVRPASPDLTLSTLTVQADGNIDLSFAGDVYVAGLTLDDAERKIAQH